VVFGVCVCVGKDFTFFSFVCAPFFPVHLFRYKSNFSQTAQDSTLFSHLTVARNRFLLLHMKITLCERRRILKSKRTKVMLFFPMWGWVVAFVEA
jgi:hypothetical protein